MTDDLAAALAHAYKMKMSGQSPDIWLRKEIAEIREAAVSEVGRMNDFIKRRGPMACHLTGVYRDMLRAALKEEEETNDSADSNGRTARGG